MYTLLTANSKTEKRLREYLARRSDIRDKLERLRVDPHRSNGAHPLHGTLAGKWSCWLGSNIRLLYVIDDSLKQIIIYAVGSHALY
jgi:addiction module RelE/StbE family toxin